MKRLLNWERCLPLCAAAALLCSACALLPVEEELPAAPVLHPYEAPVYQLTNVARGNLQLQRTVSCTYMPAKKAALSFSIGGERVETVYVQQGDLVTEGQLLAELEKGDLEPRIAAEENALELLELQILHLKESRLYAEKKQEYALKRLEETPWLPRSSLEEQTAELEKNFAYEEGGYQNALRALEDGVRLEREILAKLREQLRERQVTAPFAGAVTYVRKLEDGAKARAGERLLTVSDAATSVFVVSGKDDLAYFSPGGRVEVACHGESYPAEVVDGPSLGVPGGGEEAVYLRLLSPGITLEDGDFGSVTLLLDERRGVLCLPSGAVSSADGGKIVYYLDGNGLRAAKEITTGLDTGKYVEILSGLSEGDSVILPS